MKKPAGSEGGFLSGLSSSGGSGAGAKVAPLAPPPRAGQVSVAADTFEPVLRARHELSLIHTRRRQHLMAASLLERHSSSSRIPSRVVTS